MKYRLLVSAFVALLAIPAFAGVVTIETMAPDAVAEVGLYGKGLCMLQVEPDGTGLFIFETEELAEGCRFDDHDFRPIEEIKIVLMVPGQAIATHASNSETHVWRPELMELPRFRLKGQVVPPPPVSAKAEVAYWLFDVMDFFGYADGSAPRLVLGTAPLDKEGRFDMEIPNLLHDPFIEQPPRDAEILMRLDDPEENWIAYSLPLAELYDPRPLVLDESKKR